MTLQLIVTISIYIGICLLGVSIAASITGQYRAATATSYLYLLACTVFYAIRAYMKEFFPFTDKIESFVRGGSGDKATETVSSTRTNATVSKDPKL